MRRLRPAEVNTLANASPLLDLSLEHVGVESGRVRVCSLGLCLLGWVYFSGIKGNGQLASLGSSIGSFTYYL